MSASSTDAVQTGGMVRADVTSAGREEAFLALYATSFPDLAAYCHALTRDGDLADEIAQETLTRVWARWPLLREPRAYAFRVAHNLACAHWADRRREADAWSQVVPYADDADSALWDAVRHLPARHRDIVLLHYLADLSVADVARAVRRPPGTVKRRLHEARALLATMLGDLR